MTQAASRKSVLFIMPELKIENILGKAPLLSFAINREERIAFIHGGLLGQLEIDPQSALGQAAFRVLNLPMKKTHFRKALRGESFAISLTIQGRSYETQVAPYKAGDEIIGVTGLTMDMTKHLELQHFLDEEKYQLLAAQRLNSLAGIASGLAHEINNPLMIISGYAQQLFDLAEKGTLTQERILYTSKKLVETAARCHRIIESLRTFARDGSRDAFHGCSVNDWVGATISLCQEKFQALGVSLIWEPLAVDLSFEGRRIQLIQALFNILINACEAAVHHAKPQVEVACHQEGNFLELRIKDNGPGIHESFRVQVFEPFFTTKDQSRSVGIGLSTAKGVVEVHHGLLTFTSQPGATCFQIRIPRQQPQIAALKFGPTAS